MGGVLERFFSFSSFFLSLLAEERLNLSHFQAALPNLLYKKRDAEVGGTGDNPCPAQDWSHHLVLDVLRDLLLLSLEWDLLLLGLLDRLLLLDLEWDLLLDLLLERLPGTHQQKGHFGDCSLLRAKEIPKNPTKPSTHSSPCPAQELCTLKCQ